MSDDAGPAPQTDAGEFEIPPLDGQPDTAPPRLTPHCQLRRIEAVVNEASGSVGAGAGEALEQIVNDHGLSVRVSEVEPKRLQAALEAAVAAKPDLLVILAGDGTARMGAELAGPDGPLVAPLPGGTMNVLPKALYGDRDWRGALTAALEEGIVRPVSGGEVNGRHFFVAAILGAPALWAPAREAIRHGQIGLAVQRALRAWRKAFHGQLLYQLENDPFERAEALAVLCPLISKVLDEETALEAAVLDPKGAADAFRLGFHAAFGDWRHDPAVKTRPCRRLIARSPSFVPAILDGETVRLGQRAEIRFRKVAFRALSPPGPHPADTVPAAPIL